MKYLSFFSGALGLDLGLEKFGFEPLMYCEVDKFCQETIRLNKPAIPLLGDIKNYSAEDILKTIGYSKNDKIDLIVGGPPCQAFSTAGARRSFEDERGNAFIYFLEIATKLNPTYLVIENVRGLLSASYKPSDNVGNKKEEKGTALKFILNFLEEKGYKVSFNLYNSANFGVPQVRERIVIIATKKDTKVPYLIPTHSNDESFGLPKWQTLKQAISDIPYDKNKVGAVFPDKRLKYYRLLKNGQNWRSLPQELQEEAIGKAYHLGGGKTGFLRRLDWNKPSPTLVTSPTMPATDLAHPEEDRPLSVAEYARIQQFPDDWIFAGKIAEQYKQIGNAVPCNLGFAIAETIYNHSLGITHTLPEGFPYSRYKNTSDTDWLNKKS